MNGFRRSTSSESGFTLIELMVVVLVIGILMTIALPVMLGARQRANDRAAQADLRIGVAAAKVHFADDDTYSNFTGGLAGTAEAIEPSLDWIGSSDPGPTDATAIAIASGSDLVLVRRSDAGRYFCLADQPDGAGFSRGVGPTYASVDTVAECANGWS